MISQQYQIGQMPISELRKKDRDGELILRPDFQRRLVWSQAAKVELIETILLGMPIPELYLSYDVDGEGVEMVSVVDGQQRLTAVLEFLDNKWPLDGLSEDSDAHRYEGLYFRDIAETDRQNFFRYRFPTRRLENVDDETVRKVFARVNKTNVVLTAQELRNALYPGPFNDFLRDCAKHRISVEASVFSSARSSRGGDLEFYAEVFSSCLFGLSNKKAELDERYELLAREFSDYNAESMEFIRLLDDLATLGIWQRRTRWSNIVDFFTLLEVGWEHRRWIHRLAEEGELVKLAAFLDSFQAAVSVWKVALGSRDPEAAIQETRVPARVFTEDWSVETLAKDWNVQYYCSGIRNSSDLAARRARSIALSGALQENLGAT